MKRLLIFLLLALPCWGTTTIAVNNAAITHGRSPYNWVVTGSTSMLATNPNAYIKLGFTGTSIGVTVDPSALVAQSYAANTYPVIAWTVDGVNRQTHQLTSSDTLIALFSGSAGNHILRIDFIGTDESGTGNRWSSGAPMSLVIDNFIIDTAASAFNAPLNNGGYAIFFSDSTGEGAIALANVSGSNYAQVEDATMGWQAYLGANLNVEYGTCSFAGQGWVNFYQTSGVPPFAANPPTTTATTWNYIINGVPRVFSPVPNLAIALFGTNDYGFTLASSVITNWMIAFRAALVAQDAVAGPRCEIVVADPFGYTGDPYGAIRTTLQAAYNNYVAAYPSDTLVAFVNLGSNGQAIVTANAYSLPHPNAAGYYLLSVPFTPLVPFPLGAGLNPSGSLVHRLRRHTPPLALFQP